MGEGSAASTSGEAQAAMEKADRNTKDFEAQMAAANVFYRLKDYAKATLYGDKALALKSKDFDALVLLGNVKFDDRQFVEAAKFYERALAVKPNSPDVRTDLGSTYFQRTPPDYDRAIAEYRKSVAIDPQHINSWRNIAAAAMRKKDKALAAEAIEKLAGLEPNSPQVQALRQGLAELGQ
jgi:tetratricopeptide (TPR) repeat protein